MEIISLYDFTGAALKPWAHAGYACYAYDIEHPPSGRMTKGIHYEHADLHDEATVQNIIARHKGGVKLLSAFPVCTDLAASGAVWWARKRECDPKFQYTAAGAVGRRLQRGRLGVTHDGGGIFCAMDSASIRECSAGWMGLSGTIWGAPAQP